MAINMKRGNIVKSEKKKIKIISVSKNESREMWTFEKTQAFIPSLLKFLLDLGFSLEDDFDIKFYFGAQHGEGGDEYLTEKYIKDPFSQEYLDINLFDQEIYTFNKKNCDIEVIFFDNRIVLVLRTDKKSKEIGKLISKFADF